VKELDSYLNDHLAGSVSALAVIAHWADMHKDQPLGAFFAETERDIKADQDTLLDVMRSRGVKESKCARQAHGQRKRSVARD
jgi:hypothetical protein